MEYYIHHIPVFLLAPTEGASIPDFCSAAEGLFNSPELLSQVDVVYVGNLRELGDRNATYANGGIYITNQEKTVEDMLENFVHEVAHSLEDVYGPEIYTENLINEFKAKRHRLCEILKAHGYSVSEPLCTFTEYSRAFDEFLSNEVGYPTLLSLTMGLFVSPYGATSIQEYYANGFEKYYLEDPMYVRKISPVLYEKIEGIINDAA